MRTLARRAIEHVLLPLGGAARRRLARLRGSAILSYHNVAPDGAEPTGDTSLHLPLRSFLDQIGRLSRTHRIVTLGDLVEGRFVGGDRPLAAITFDDAYRGAVTLGVSALVERGVPATIFVAPGLLGANAFWWDALAAPDGSGLDPDVREHALEKEGGRPATAGRSTAALRQDQGPADAEGLARVAELPGVSLASHSWSHPNLATLSAEELEGELERPKSWLRATFPNRSLEGHFAFPYGIWNGRVAAAARAAGYRYLYRVEGGIARLAASGNSPLPRINVPAGVSGAGFELRVAGLIGSTRSR